MTAQAGGGMMLVESSAPPQAHFQHHDVAVLLDKVEHAQGGDQFKLGGHVLHGLGRRLYLLHQPDQVLVGNGCAVDLDPLVEPVDEGGSEQPHFVPGGPQAAVQHGSGAALAVGAGNVDKLQLLVGVAQGGQQGADPVQAGLVALPVDRVDVCQRLVVIHSERLPVKLPRAAAIRL